jgi:hypothetical protein
VFFEAIAIEQSFSLATNATTNFLRLRMPNKADLVLSISDEDLKRVLDASGDLPAEAGNDDAAPDPLEPSLIPWRRIPDDSLPGVVKVEFERLGMPEHMTVGDIAFHAHRIMSGADGSTDPGTGPNSAEPPHEAPRHDVDGETGVPQV